MGPGGKEGRASFSRVRIFQSWVLGRKNPFLVEQGG